MELFRLMNLKILPKKIGMEVDDSISVILINKYEKNEDGRIFYGDFVRFLNNGGDI